MKVVLINPYELGRQPFALAQPAAILKQQGFDVACLDLSLQKLETSVLHKAGFVAIYLGMHTATRIALEALPRIKQLAPDATLCVFGLYAPMNAEMFFELGVRFAFGGEVERDLVAAVIGADKVRNGVGSNRPVNEISIAKQDFVIPDRGSLPTLDKYAHLNLPDGDKKTVGFAEASRGCKHLCRHCPVVPVYQGRFRIVPVEIVLADIRQQVVQGAQHISFGDPDFLNGPTHALRIVRAVHSEFPDVTFDATVKIEHILKHTNALPELAEAGCLFLTSAVESVDDRTLGFLDKNHTSDDFATALGVLNKVGIAMAPTFVPFTPWTTLEGYLDLLRTLLKFQLVESVPPVQLSIRLLVPQGSYLLNLPGFEQQLEPFDAATLGYPWQHQDARVDELQKKIMNIVMDMEAKNISRKEIFETVWKEAHIAADQSPPDLLQAELGEPIPAMSEPWYCCAEPTEQQLVNF